MQTFRIVIEMTGLLLVTPHAQDRGPTYVLFPDTTGVGPHFAQIGYAGPSCPASAADPDRICWVSVDNSFVELGKGVADGERDDFPAIAGNLSARMKKGVRPDHDEPNPTGIRARVTLHAGEADFCGIANWVFATSIDRPDRQEVVPLTNVLTWTIENAGSDALDLVVTPINGGTADPIRVTPDGTNTVRLFIRHSPPQPRGGPADHFRAYYRYLDVTNAPLPHHPTRIKTPPIFGQEKQCRWNGRLGSDHSRSVGTLNCMIASADPQ